jgi:hypothetical protein
MFSFTEDQVRHLILEILYNQEKENPSSFTDRQTMQKMLNVPEKQIDFNMIYLAQKSLVHLELAGGAPWYCAEITAFGIDVIEQKEKYQSQFSFINATVNVQGDNYGNIAQAVGASAINFNQQVSDAFKKAYEVIEGKTDIASEQKEEIKKNAKMLEEELKKEKLDAGRIQQLWNWLQQNASWIVPTLAPIVMEGIKMAFGGSA